MPGNPLVRFDEGRVGRTARCRPLSYSTTTNDQILCGSRRFHAARAVSWATVADMAVRIAVMALRPLVVTW